MMQIGLHLTGQSPMQLLTSPHCVQLQVICGSLADRCAVLRVPLEVPTAELSHLASSEGHHSTPDGNAFAAA